jgi:C4-dicarboxylate transporter, DctQ subunit
MKGNSAAGEKGPKEPFEGVLFNILTIVLFLTVALQVFSRWIFNRSVSWTEEFSRYFFIWSSCFAISLAAYHKRHIRITAHINLLPVKVRKAVLTAADILWILFNITIVYYSSVFIASMFRYPVISGTMGFNIVWIYLIIPICYSLLTVRIIQNLVRMLKAEDFTLIDQRKEV